MDNREELTPHVLIFPFPIQGHINSMLKLAELLCLDGIHVTFLLTDHSHGLLLRHSNVQSHFSSYSGFRFETISDGLPDDYKRSGNNNVVELLICLGETAKPLLKDLLMRSKGENHSNSGGGDNNPITCVIADGIQSFALEVAEEIGIPVIYFRTSSGCNFWASFCIPELIEAGELPFQGTINYYYYYSISVWGFFGILGY